ncbi:RICIN domain-containing protein [Pedobacter sp. FW305-3-2-15-E-R2A2]|uniref:RICIN domain-containing protein n=1 Tax=Pedobacter sp. FW305-3-2-15-E-R2A2 TaxID=3140251 RepID=UPI0031403A27
MAFKHLSGQRYFLIAKHSGKALGFKNEAIGSSLIQMTLDIDNENQKFSFDEGNNFHWIMSAYRDRYLAIDNNSAADKARIIQWHYEPGKANHHFHLDPAGGGGYYRIRALHSDKFLDVINASEADEADVSQHQFSGTDNQLFKMVPVTDDPVGKSPMSYAETNEMGRAVLLGVIGAIPKVGGGISAVIGFFWSSKNTLSELWDQMKTYVDARIFEILEKHIIDDLRDDVAGLLNIAKEFDGLSPKTAEKGSKLISAISYGSGRQTHFLNKKPSVLPYLIGLGTIMLVLRRNLLVEYEDVFGYAPTPNDYEKHLESLKECIRVFSKDAEKHKKSLMKSRLSHIADPKEVVIHVQNMIGDTRYNYVKFSVVEDTFDNWTMSWSDVYIDFAQTAQVGYKDHKKRAEYAVLQRRKQIVEQYESELDELMVQAKLWKHFDPKESEYTEKIVKRSVGTFGGFQGTTAFEGITGSKISRLTLFQENGSLVGLTIGYKGQTTDLTVGKFTGNSTSLVLEDEEYITSVYGHMKNHIEGLWFVTEKGRFIGAGKTNEMGFSADLGDGLKAKLVRISGAHNNNLIEQLNFHWEYTY